MTREPLLSWWEQSWFSFCLGISTGAPLMYTAVNLNAGSLIFGMLIGCPLGLTTWAFWASRERRRRYPLSNGMQGPQGDRT